MAFGQDTTRHKLIIGAHGGPAVATSVSFNKTFSDPTSTIGPRLGYIAGLDLQRRLTYKLALCLEANYESKGYIHIDKSPYAYVKFGNSTNSGGYGTPFEKLRIEIISDFITIPVTAKILMNRKKVAYFFNLGFFAAYPIRSRFLLLSANSEPIVMETFYPNGFNYRSINYGLVTGFGVNIPHNEQFQFSLEVRNNIELKNIFKENEYQFETCSLLLGIGYKLK
ncbi:MAG: PorT family protein [Bacteroidetes bacterium]|nr:PorT family protein [Bacteroidota bacterium]